MIRAGYVVRQIAETLFRDRPVTFDGTSEQTSSIIVQALFGQLVGGSSCLKDVHTVAYDSPFSSS
jgi:hypothetical protein